MVTKSAQTLNFARPAVRFGIGLVALLLVRFIVNRLPMLEGSMAIDGFVLSYSSIGSAIIDTLIILLILSFGTDIGRQLGVRYPRFRQLSQITTLVTTLVVLLIAYNSYGSVGSALLRDQGIYDLIFLLITAVALIALALEDPLARTISDPDSEDEERFITLGQDALGRLLVVVYTWRARSRLRVISARKANRGERGEYEEKK